MRVRVVHMWEVPDFFNPSESSSLEMVLVYGKVSLLCFNFVDSLLLPII
jgi:hypothetical protein